MASRTKSTRRSAETAPVAPVQKKQAEPIPLTPEYLAFERAAAMRPGVVERCIANFKEPMRFNK